MTFAKEYKKNSEIKNRLKANTSQSTTLKNTEFEAVPIKLEEIKINEKNFYSVKNIDELAEDIKLNGLYHNIVVRKLDNPIEKIKYEILSGERRYSAYKKLSIEHKIYNYIPCKIVSVNDEDAEILLIEANALTRTLSTEEKIKQVEELSRIFKAKKDRGEKIPGRIQKQISDHLKISESAVGRLQNIINNLSDSLKEKLYKEELSISNADIFATLSKAKQKVVSKVIEKKKLTKDKALDLKNKLDEISEDLIIIDDSNNLDLEKSADIVNSIIQEYTNKNTKDKLVHTKELHLENNLTKLNKSILKLTNDLDKKDIINLEEGVSLLEVLEKNINELLLKIKQK